MHDRRVGQGAVGPRPVVVGDQHVEAGRARGGHLLDGGDGAVDGDQKPRPARREALHRGRREAVAVVEPAGQVPVHLGAEAPQAADDDRGRADAVDVVVAVDRDPRPRPHVAEDEVHRGRHAAERARRVLVGGLEEGRGGLG